MKILILFTISLLTLFQHLPIQATPSLTNQLADETELIKERSKRTAQFYELPDGVDILEITDKILASSFVKEARKKEILASGRRIFVFTYPSDGLQVKGYISFVSQPDKHPIIVQIRGGNQDFGLPSPASDIATLRNFTAISTTYRGGISDGQDEFGGADVNDVKNLIDYIPELERKLQINLNNDKLYMIGESRGGMQMFLALARFPELQKKITKIVSLSGILDLRMTIDDRQDMKELFIEDFGYVEGEDGEDWINARNPILQIKHLRPDLPILIIQTTEDLRIKLDEGHHFVSELDENGCNYTYWEIPDADHCMSNISDRMNLIANWLEQE